ncbi:MAG TPA: hypothetical protein VF008_20015 [Niastella sp.]
MLKHIIFPLFIISLLFGLSGCHKNSSDDSTNPNNPPITNNPPIIDKDSGSFLALVNNKEWHPIYHSAIYFPKWNQLYISASDTNILHSNKPTLYGGINLDAGNLLKKYLLQPNGENTFRLTYTGDATYTGDFFSDHNMADAGGSFTLTKFDTVKKTISGILQFKGGHQSLLRTVDFSSTKIEDLPLKIDNQNYNGNYASYTIQGATTADLKSKDIYAKIDCVSGTEKSLYIGICSVLQEFPDVGRNIFIQVPLTNGKGKYQVYPALPPYNTCGDTRIISSYCGQYFSKKYFAVSGELNIESIDAANRKLEATFNVQYRDTTSKGETITISNGKVSLSTWAN